MLTGTNDPATNTEDWEFTIELFDDETGEPYFIYATSATHPTAITLKLRDEESGDNVLEISMAAGQIVLADDGIAEVAVPLATMEGIAAKTYTIGVLYTYDGKTKQLILGSQPILEGL